MNKKASQIDWLFICNNILVLPFLYVLSDIDTIYIKRDYYNNYTKEKIKHHKILNPTVDQLNSWIYEEQLKSIKQAKKEYHSFENYGIPYYRWFNKIMLIHSSKMSSALSHIL